MVTDFVSHKTSTLTSGHTYTAGFVLARVAWPATLAPNTSGNIEFYWQGDPTFPVTATYTPQPGCSSQGFTCVAGSHAFAARTQPLVWIGGAYCTFSGPSHSGVWRLQLTDATGTRTNIVLKTFVCGS